MILALDIATQTGWARRTEDGIIFGTHSFAHLPKDHALIGRKFHWWLTDLIAEQGKPSEVIIEQPFFMQRSPMAGVFLHKLCHEAHRVAELQKIPRFEYAPTTVKKFMTGSGRAKKPEMMEAVKAKGYDITTDHEADAIAILLYHESLNNS